MNKIEVKQHYVYGSEARVLSTPYFKVWEGGLSSKSTTTTSNVSIATSFYKAEKSQEARVAPLKDKIIASVIGLAFVAGLVFTGVQVVASQKAAVQNVFSSLPLTTVVVSQGDSLWTIASEAKPEGASVEDTVSYIMQSNNLQSKLLQPGQELFVPASK